MRLIPRLSSRLRSWRVLLAAFAIGSLLPGCGGAHRPASSLSEHERAELDSYEKIRAALANDDARSAKNGAVTLLAELKKSSASPATHTLTVAAQEIADSKALDQMRQSFVSLSSELLPTAAGVDGYYIMTCPPGFNGDWIQRTPDVDNPYFGQVMHASGSLKK